MPAPLLRGASMYQDIHKKHVSASAGVGQSNAAMALVNKSPVASV